MEWVYETLLANAAQHLAGSCFWKRAHLVGQDGRGLTSTGPDTPGPWIDFNLDTLNESYSHIFDLKILAEQLAEAPRPGQSQEYLYYQAVAHPNSRHSVPST